MNNNNIKRVTKGAYNIAFRALTLLEDIQCQTAKVHQFSSTGNRFFTGKQTPESFSGRLKMSKNTLFLFFPRFFWGRQTPGPNFTI